MPHKWIDYAKLMRFDKPIGILLLFWPVCWALLLAYQPYPPLSLVIVFTIGVIFTRAAGCIINDLSDRHFDRHVARTNERPLTTGTLCVKEALGLLAILGLMLASLLLFLNKTNTYIAILAVALTVFYPLTKRFFAFPQGILGITFNMGVLMVFVESGHLSITGWLLYGASIAWTFAYDTVYALADMAEDAQLQLRSSALSLGKHVHLAVGLSYAIMFLLLGFALRHAWMGCLAAVLAMIAYRACNTWISRSPIAFFKANGVLGGLIALCIFYCA